MHSIIKRIRNLFATHNVWSCILICNDLFLTMIIKWKYNPSIYTRRVCTKYILKKKNSLSSYGSSMVGLNDLLLLVLYSVYSRKLSSAHRFNNIWWNIVSMVLVAHLYEDFFLFNILKCVVLSATSARSLFAL